MPLGGGSGEGGLAARGYNGPAQPGGNYGGTNVVGTGGGFLGDRSAINNAVLAAQNPSTSSGTQTKTYKVVTDPITGKKTKVLTSINGKPVKNAITTPPPQDVPAAAEVPDMGYGSPIGPIRGYPGMQGMPGYDDPYSGWNPNYTGPGSTHPKGTQPSNNPGYGNVNNQQGPSADIGTGGDVMGGGLLGGSPSGMGDIGAQRMMMAAPETPAVSPGPIGPGGQPMGNRPPPFQWGARDLALRHGLEQMMRHRQQMARRPQYDRNEHVQRILRAAARRGRA